MDPAVCLISSDQKRFTIPVHIAQQSIVLASLFEEIYEDGVLPSEMSTIPLPTIKSSILDRIIRFLMHHEEAEFPKLQRPLKKPLSEYLDPIDKEIFTLSEDDAKDLICAADYLDIRRLFVLASACVAQILSSKTVEEMREFFGVENDYTEEELEEIREQFSQLNEDRGEWEDDLETLDEIWNDNARIQEAIAEEQMKPIEDENGKAEEEDDDTCV
jgi:S-phase kinase-associated protein 1